MEKIEEFTKDLFVVKPSIVKLDTPIYKDNDFIHIENLNKDQKMLQLQLEELLILEILTNKE